VIVTNLGLGDTSLRRKTPDERKLFVRDFPVRIARRGVLSARGAGFDTAEADSLHLEPLARPQQGLRAGLEVHFPNLA
jgi:hypothetical protein